MLYEGIQSLININENDEKTKSQNNYVRNIF